MNLRWKVSHKAKHVSINFKSSMANVLLPDMTFDPSQSPGKYYNKIRNLTIQYPQKIRVPFPPDGKGGQGIPALAKTVTDDGQESGADAQLYLEHSRSQADRLKLNKTTTLAFRVSCELVTRIQSLASEQGIFFAHRMEGVVQQEKE